jgi:hypothetical protein
MEISQLYLRDSYLNKNIPYLCNKKIIEYDLKSANTSLCKEYDLLPEDKIQQIEDLPKKERVVKIGKMMRKDKKFTESLKSAFVDIRKRFFEANQIQDEDVLSIKKDAIFCLRECEYTEFGKCKFVEKNVYTSYLYLNRLEFYYNSKGESIEKPKLDVKGLSEDAIYKHEGFMMKFFCVFFKHLETSSLKTQMLFLKRFITKYKLLGLEVGYYREFNNESRIRLSDSEETYDEEIFIPYEHKQEHLNIDYNFFYILIPLAKMLI